MQKNISQFKIPMHDFISDDSFEGIENLYKELDGLLFRDGFIFLEILLKISFVAILKDEIKVVGSFFDVVQSDDVFIIAGPEYFNFIFEQL